MPLTAEEKERCRFHLGYTNTSPVAALQLGIPRASQPLFLVERSMDLLLPEGEPRVRQYLGILDGIEVKLVESLDRLAAKQVGEIVLNPMEGEQLQREYVRWRQRLAVQLGVYENPFEPGGGLGGGGINVPVRES